MRAAARSGSDETAPERFDAERAFADLEAQVEIGPRPTGSPESRELVKFLAESLRTPGREDVAVQRPYRNVVATIPGTGEGTVVVGAHHDTKDIPGFVGANDGASGVAVVLELARVLAAEAPLDGPSVSIALFDAEEARGDRPFEEDGTRGSRQYVADAEAGGRQGTPPLEDITSMILFDLVGDCDLQVPREELSDQAIYDRFAEAATRDERLRRRPSRAKPRAWPTTTCRSWRPACPPSTSSTSRSAATRAPAPTGTRPRTRSTRSAPRASTPWASPPCASSIRPR